MPLSSSSAGDGLIGVLFTLDLVAVFVLLAGVVWSVVCPERRIWPPPGRRSWQYVVVWVCFAGACGLNACGRTNSLGLGDGFVAAGPYRFTRNPQYLGDNVLFLGLCIIANSQLLWVTHALLALALIIKPLSEEVWLQEQYGEEYERYRRDTPRFL